MPIHECSTCRRIFPSKAKLSRHRRDEHGPRALCEWCPYSVPHSRQWMLVKHMRICRGRPDSQITRSRSRTPRRHSNEHHSSRHTHSSGTAHKATHDKSRADWDYDSPLRHLSRSPRKSQYNEDLRSVIRKRVPSTIVSSSMSTKGAINQEIVRSPAPLQPPDVEKTPSQEPVHQVDHIPKQAPLQPPDVEKTPSKEPVHHVNNLPKQAPIQPTSSVTYETESITTWTDGEMLDVEAGSWTSDDTRITETLEKPAEPHVDILKQAVQTAGVVENVHSPVLPLVSDIEKKC